MKRISLSVDQKRLASNFFSLLALRGFDFIIPLITLPYLVQTVGIENFGRIGFAISLSMYFGAVIQYGFSVSATRAIARGRDSKVELCQIYSKTIFLSLFLSLVSIILCCLIIFIIPELKKNYDLYVITLISIVLQALFPVWFFQGMERMKYIAIFSSLTKLSILIGLLLFVKSPSDYILVPLLNAIAALLALLYSGYLIRSVFDVRLKIPSVRDVKDLALNDRHSFINQFAPNLYNNSSVFILGALWGPAYVGAYLAATKVIDAFCSIGHILSSVFLPYLSRNFSNHRYFEMFMLSVGILGSMFTFFLSDHIANFLYSDEGRSVSICIKYLSPCVAIIFCTLVYGTNGLMLVNRDHVLKNISLYVSLVFFFVALILIESFDIYGAMISLVGARLTMAILVYLFFKKGKSSGEIL